MYELVVRRPVAVSMVVIGIVVFGIIAYKQLPLNLMPRITYPRLTIRTEYPGSGPEEVELEVSRQVESILGTIGHLSRMSSRSRSGISEVILEFDWKVNINLAMQEVREKLDLLRLPDGAKRPILLRYDPNLDPMMRIGLSSKTADLYRLRLYAEDVLQPALETMLGVAAVQIRGGLEREVEVALDENKMRGLKLNIDVISRRLKEENINLAGGQLKEGTTYYWVRTLNEFQSLDEMGNLIIAQRDGSSIRLKDIAKLKFRNKDPEVITRINGKPSVELAVYREAEANIVTVAQTVKNKIFGTQQQQAYVKKMLLEKPKKKRKRWGKKSPRGSPGKSKGEGDNSQSKAMKGSKAEGRKRWKRGGRKGRRGRRGREGRWRRMTPAQRKAFRAKLRKMTPQQRRAFFRKRRAARRGKQGRRGARKGGKGRRGKGRKGRKGRRGKWGRGKKGRKGKRRRRGRGYWKMMRKESQKKRKRRAMTNFLEFSMPSEMNIQVLIDQATFIKSSIDEVLQAAIVGGGFAILVLLLFMRNLWSTIIIGLSIPLSVVATFGGLYLSGVSLNIMSLGGLALGIGMLVDNSIVVLESILRFREDGHPPDEAAIEGSKEVGGAVTASTLTTVAVFFPIVFVQGVSGQLLRDLALTVVLSLISSLFVALYFIPTLAALRLPVAPPESEKKPLTTGWTSRWVAWQRLKGALVWFRDGWSGSLFKKLWLIILAPVALAYFVLTFPLQTALEILSFVWRNLTTLVLWVFGFVWKGISWIMKMLWAPIFWVVDLCLNSINWAYPKILLFTLKNKLAILSGVILLVIYTYTLLPSLKTEFMPKVHQGEFNLEIAFPVGTPLVETARRLKLIEQQLSKHPNIQGISAVIGVEKTESQSADKGEHTATLTLSLKGKDNLEGIELQTIQQLRTYLQDIPSLKMKVTYPSLFSLRTPIEVEIKGENLKKLKSLSQDALVQMKDIQGLRDIRTTALGGLPEIRIVFQRDRLLQYGLNVEQLSKAIRDKLFGASATKYRLKEHRLDVSVRVERKQLKSIRDLMNLSIISNSGQTVPLRHLAKTQIDEGPSEILRVGNRRAVVLRAEVEGMALGDATNAVESMVNQLQIPGAYSAGLSGQSEEMKKSLNSLMFALLLSIFLVYLVMASQFESLLSPFIILFSIPLAFIGVVILFNWINMAISAMVLIGAIILTGIVVNNAIVLVDAINHLRDRGVELTEAVKQASMLRLRPILMTTLTTALGLLPLALGLGEGSELRRPMAITLMAGLVFSTVLTLLVIPMLYELAHRRRANEIEENDEIGFSSEDPTDNPSPQF